MSAVGGLATPAVSYEERQAQRWERDRHWAEAQAAGLVPKWQARRARFKIRRQIYWDAFLHGLRRVLIR